MNNMQIKKRIGDQCRAIVQFSDHVWKHKYMKTILVLVVVLAAVLFVTLRGIEMHNKENLYKNGISVWAWDRQENLMFLENSKIPVSKVYYFAYGIEVNYDAETKTRSDYLFVPDTIPAVPVIRIDTKPVSDYAKELGETSQLEGHIDDIASEIVFICNTSKTKECQVDYEPVESEIPAYIKLLENTQQHLDTDVHLGITALVSWCTPKSWLETAPVDVL
jgi:hypothetical protein